MAIPEEDADDLDTSSLYAGDEFTDAPRGGLRSCPCDCHRRETETVSRQPKHPTDEPTEEGDEDSLPWNQRRYGGMLHRRSCIHCKPRIK